jgi:hypothetical protein
MKHLLIISAFLAAINLNAQHSNNAVSIELGGGGLLYSLNYEHFVAQNFVLKAGFSFFAVEERQTDKSMQVLSLPLSVSYLQPIYKQKHYLEVGIGNMNLITNGDLVEYKGSTDIFLNPYLLVGYRYKHHSQKWQLKMNFTPFYGTKSIITPTEQGFRPFGSTVQLWGGLGFVYLL